MSTAARKERNRCPPRSPQPTRRVHSAAFSAAGSSCSRGPAHWTKRSLFRAALSAQEIAGLADRKPAPHPVPRASGAVTLWSGGEVPKSADLPSIEGVEFHVLKKQRPDTDGCRWTLGVGLAWHNDKLYASYGFNQGGENTPTEEAHVRVSSDGGRTWGAPVVMDHARAISA
jgi:hypothetical protein